MVVALAILAVIVALFALGFTVATFLLVIAAILLVPWLLGFVARTSPDARWYRW